MAGKSRTYFLLLASAAFLALVSCGVPYGVYHTVGKGQTLYNISRVYNVPIADIERMNNIQDTTDLKPGEKIFIPGADKVLYVPPTVETGQVESRNGAVKRTAHTGQSNTEYTGKHAAIGTAVPGAPSPKFSWPLHGRILQTFSVSNGSKHDGIDIKASEGSPVRAAASGSVIYSNDTIRGYGNMIIIKHRDGFVTVYAHNSVNMVQQGQEVSRGQIIAKVGHTGYATGPHLHFEIRLHAIPQDPLRYLPGETGAQ